MNLSHEKKEKHGWENYVIHETVQEYRELMLSCIKTSVIQDSFSFLVAMKIKVVVRVEI